MEKVFTIDFIIKDNIMSLIIMRIIYKYIYFNIIFTKYIKDNTIKT